jgi:hypothetical protein
MEQSLLAWRLKGSVRCTADGATLVSCDNHEIRIEPSPPGLPFREKIHLFDKSRELGFRLAGPDGRRSRENNLLCWGLDYF